jgi:hypothetical protein
MCIRAGESQASRTTVPSTGSACDLGCFRSSRSAEIDPIFRFLSRYAGRAGRQIDDFVARLTQVCHWADRPVVFRRILAGSCCRILRPGTKLHATNLRKNDLGENNECDAEAEPESPGDFRHCDYHARNFRMLSDDRLIYLALNSAADTKMPKRPRAATSALPNC